MHCVLYTNLGMVFQEIINLGSEICLEQFQRMILTSAVNLSLGDLNVTLFK